MKKKNNVSLSLKYLHKNIIVSLDMTNTILLKKKLAKEGIPSTKSTSESCLFSIERFEIISCLDI